MHHQLVFNGRRGHVLAFAGLEQVFDAARDVQQALVVNVPFVSGTQPAIGRHGRAGLLGLFVVTQHQRLTAHLDFAVVRRNAHLHAVVSRAHGALLWFAWLGDV